MKSSELVIYLGYISDVYYPISIDSHLHESKLFSNTFKSA